MSRFCLLALLSLVVSSCSVSTPVSGTHYAMEDLVLIEFAARLEEDYHRLHPGETPAGSSLGNRKTEVSNPPADVGGVESHEPVQEQVEYDQGK